ncbi:hypothetical protein BDV06DRAFT_225138 [Aspergillus oleicola]
MSPSSDNIHGLSHNPNASRQIHAYLIDWGYAPAESQYTDMAADFETEANIYRKPDRQGRPKQKFGRVQNIYALGVVLLKNELWATMSRVMGAKIAEARKTGRLPSRKNFAAELVSLAMSGLPKELGVAYTQALSLQQDDSRRALKFQDNVVGEAWNGLSEI